MATSKKEKKHFGEGGGGKRGQNFLKVARAEMLEPLMHGLYPNELWQ